jgi:hypothetical protein
VRAHVERIAARFGISAHLRRLIVVYVCVKVVAWPVIAWSAANGCF